MHGFSLHGHSSGPILLCSVKTISIQKCSFTYLKSTSKYLHLKKIYTQKFSCCSQELSWNWCSQPTHRGREKCAVNYILRPWESSRDKLSKCLLSNEPLVSKCPPLLLNSLMRLTLLIFGVVSTSSHKWTYDHCVGCSQAQSLHSSHYYSFSMSCFMWEYALWDRKQSDTYTNREDYRCALLLLSLGFF